MYLVLSFVLKEKKNRKMWIREGIVLSILSVLLGMTGLRYLASLYLPMLLAFLLFPVLERDGNKKENWQNITFSLLLTGFAGIGFLINKFYLAVQYSFDTTSEVSFVPIDEIPDRFLTSIRLMLEFMGLSPDPGRNAARYCQCGKMPVFSGIYCDDRCTLSEADGADR